MSLMPPGATPAELPGPSNLCLQGIEGISPESARCSLPRALLQHSSPHCAAQSAQAPSCSCNNLSGPFCER